MQTELLGPQSFMGKKTTKLGHNVWLTGSNRWIKIKFSNPFPIHKRSNMLKTDSSKARCHPNIQAGSCRNKSSSLNQKEFNPKHQTNCFTLCQVIQSKISSADMSRSHYCCVFCFLEIEKRSPNFQNKNKA